MTEIEALLQRARESHTAACHLLQEGFPDFSASRAYYAMFYVAQALLAHLGQAYSSHAAVIASFGREYAKTGKADRVFHRRLISAQNFRNVGDYGIEEHVSPEQAGAVCAWAREFIEFTERFLNKASANHGPNAGDEQWPNR